VMLAGPTLYLLGVALFKRLSAPNVPLSHLVGLGLLIVLAAVAGFASPLELATATTAILIVVALWETASFKGRYRQSPGHGR
jgi:low temperature requirement protein LtrA